ncbi:MAG: NAD(P)-dependent alcohol dehydrogenase [Marinilabiliales bacterium]|nr:MAG: NAD(P)-dependent alcohol dehydrogenase [Marinilabiliales bacterium]
MKALVINKYGGPEQLRAEEVAIPERGKSELLVRIHAAGVNPVDFKIRNGSMKFITGSRFPRILGGDIAGVVEQADPRSSYRPGDKVFGMLSLKGGGYAEFVTMKESQVCLIPEGLGMTDAASVPLAALTALQALRKGGNIQPGDRVLVNGASGGVGIFAVQIAKAEGAHVTAVCSARNTEFVSSLGADKVIDYNSEDFTKGRTRYKKVFDAVAKSSFYKCSKILEKGGRYITTVPNKGLFFFQSLNFTRSKKAGFIMAKPSGSDLGFIAGLIEQGLLRTYVQKVFPLEEGSAAHELIETERVRGKLVLSVI